MQAILKGKIVSQEFINGNNYSVVAEAAKDAYSQPSSYKIKSVQQLGQNEQEVTLSVEIGGYIKHTNYKDKETGQPKVYDNQVIYLTAVPYVSKQPQKAS